MTSGVTGSGAKRLLDKLGTQTYIDYSSDGSNTASGYEKVLFISNVENVTESEVTQTVSENIGAIWYVVGEPNAWGMAASDIVDELHDVYGWIKAADSTAKITSPSVLNFDFTCINCGTGIPSGRSWIDEFRTNYLVTYGEEPPIDIWAIDIFPLDWSSLPTVRTDVLVSSLEAYRAYIDGIPAHAGAPIWITEIGMHWGWDQLVFPPECGGSAQRAGTYQSVAVENYLDTTFRWLEANGDRLNIDRWYMYSTYADIFVCRSDGYAGLSLFNSSGEDASLTAEGIIFRDWVMGRRN